MSVFLDIRCTGHAPVTAIDVNEINRSIDGLFSADDLQIQSRLTIGVGHIHTTGNNTAKVFYFADVLFQLHVGAEEVFSFLRRFAVANTIQRQTDNATDKQSDNESERYNDAGNYKKDFFSWSSAFA